MSSKISDLAAKATFAATDEIPILDNAAGVTGDDKNKRVLKTVLLAGVTTDPSTAGTNYLRATTGWVAAGTAATKDTGTTSTTVALGDAPAAAVTAHNSAYTHTNLPSTSQKAALDAASTLSGADPVASQNYVATAISAIGAIDKTGTPSAGQYPRWTDSNTLEARSTAQVLSDIGAAAASHTQAASTISDSTAAGRALLTGADAAAQRTSLGLGTAATTDASAYAAASHNQAASTITSGVFSTDRLANSGTASGSTYLRGDQTWATVSGGSATQAFGTISVSGQSDVVADAAPDTLTLAAGSGMTITTTAGTSTITFASSGGSLDINGLTDIGAALADTDTLPVYDASATANRKSAMSRIWTYITGLITSTGISPLLVGPTEKEYAITDGAAFELDPSNGPMQTITLGASRTPKGTNFAAGQSILLQVAATSYALTFTDSTFGTGGVKWIGAAPTLSSTTVTFIEFWKIGSQVYGAWPGPVT